MSQQATRPPSFPQSRSSSRSKRRLESCWSPPDSPYGQQRHRGSLPGLPAFAGLVFRGRFPDRQLLVSGFPNLLVNVSGSHSWHGVWSYQLSDKVVAVCDRNCNVIAPFVSAPGNRNESPLLREALPQVRRIARTVGLALEGTTVSQDGVYDCRLNRKAIFNRQMVPNIDANRRGRRSTKRGGKPLFNAAIFKERFNTIERVFGWEDKFRRLLHRFERLSQLHDAFKTLAAGGTSARADSLPTRFPCSAQCVRMSYAHKPSRRHGRRQNPFKRACITCRSLETALPIYRAMPRAWETRNQ